MSTAPANLSFQGTAGKLRLQVPSAAERLRRPVTSNIERQLSSKLNGGNGSLHRMHPDAVDQPTYKPLPPPIRSRCSSHNTGGLIANSCTVT